MAVPATALVSVEEFLLRTEKPNCEYIDGVLRPKPMATRKHGRIQFLLMSLINRFPDFECASEVTVRIREGKWYVPDIIAQRRDRIQDPYALEPVHLCVEILSPGDRLSDAIEKAQEYAAWGVAAAWIVDPVAMRAWQVTREEGLREVHANLTAGAINVSLADLFAGL